MRYNVCNISSFACVIYLILQMNPFIAWITGPPMLTIPSYIFVFICFLVLLGERKIVFSKEKISLFVLILLLAVHITLPLFTEVIDLGRFIPFCILALIILFPSEVFVKTFTLFRKVHLFICFFAIFFFFGGMVAEIPHYTVKGVSFILEDTDYFYKVYGFIVSSTNTLFNIGGLNIARVCGIYAEPGHFATYLGLLILVEKLMYDKMSLLFVIAGILTFSPVFYIALIMVLLYNLFIKKGNAKDMKWYLLAILGIIVSAFMVSDNIAEQIWELSIGRNISDGGIQERLNERANQYAVNAYEHFFKSSDVLFGKGVVYVENLGMFSDFRGYIFKYGILGLLLSLIVFLKITLRFNYFSFLFFFVPFGTLIYLQRSWMFGSVYIYMLLYVMYVSYVYGYLKTNTNK